MKNAFFWQQRHLQVLDFSDVKGAVFSVAEEENRGWFSCYCGLQGDILVSKY